MPDLNGRRLKLDLKLVKPEVISFHDLKHAGLVAERRVEYQSCGAIRREHSVGSYDAAVSRERLDALRQLLPMFFRSDIFFSIDCNNKPPDTSRSV